MHWLGERTAPCYAAGWDHGAEAQHANPAENSLVCETAAAVRRHSAIKRC
jgi:hypothetical protein